MEVIKSDEQIAIYKVLLKKSCYTNTIEKSTLVSRVNRAISKSNRTN